MTPIVFIIPVIVILAVVIGLVVFLLVRKKPAKQTAVFPQAITDPQGRFWYRQGDGTGDTEYYYCPATGASCTFQHTGGYINLPAGWRY